MSRSRLVRWAGFILSVLWFAACSAPGPESSSILAEDSSPETQTSGIPVTGAPSTEAMVSETPPETTSPRADLEDFGLAPELENQVWLNTEEPLRLADLRGKVVLLDMWTFG
jgi:hypothetical protein